MKTSTLINAKIILEDSIIQNGFIHICGEKISSIGQMKDYQTPDSKEKLIDCGGNSVIPGMIDIHVHGAAGYDFMDGEQKAFREIAQALPKEGVTSFLATTITSPIDHTRKTLKNLRTYQTENNGSGKAEMLGIHLEGPFINKAQKGAQPEEAIIPPDVKLFNEWQGLCGNLIKIITYAPELDVDEVLLKELIKTEVLPSMGHTNASYDEALHAIMQGVTHATHLFNGMKGMHHRDPGVVGAALMRDEVHVEIIPDGIHFHPDLIKLIVKMKGLEGILAITDGMRAKGMPDGEYEIGRQAVIVRDGKCVLSSTGSLAGSILTMNQARLNLANWLGLSIHEQIRITAFNQARRLRIADRKGTISCGKDADLVILGIDDEVEMTICRGSIAYDRSATIN